MSDHEIIAQ
ncbi:hypothetical protein AVEN_48069-1, partial [Araneus ventricosus]